MNKDRYRVSVALCSYNGEKFIREQIDSILNQKFPVDELVISDDGSNDATCEIVKEYSRKHSNVIKFFKNKKRLGVTKNFEQCIKFCTGDIIFLSDQDDVWLYSKVSRAMDILVQNPNVSFVFSDVKIVDDQLNFLHESLWSLHHFNPRKFKWSKIEKVFFRMMFPDLIVGCSFAFRAELIKYFIPIPHQWIHDHWISVIASLVAEIHAIDEKLLLYRQHQNNLFGTGKLSIKQKINKGKSRGFKYYKEELERWKVIKRELVGTRMGNTKIKLPIKKALRIIDERIHYCSMRASIYDHSLGFSKRTSSFVAIIKLRGYRRFSYGQDVAARVIKDAIALLSPSTFG